MPLTIIPDAGDVLMCDFFGLIPPEMTKKRRVIVMSPRARDFFPQTYLVVPISKTRPGNIGDIHHEFKPRSYECFDPAESVWALGDMLTCVSSKRLDRLSMNGRYQRFQIRKEDLHRVRQTVMKALALHDWHEAEVKLRIAAAQSTSP